MTLGCTCGQTPHRLICAVVLGADHTCVDCGHPDYWHRTPVAYNNRPEGSPVPCYYPYPEQPVCGCTTRH